jgi:hypothetical protein
MANRFLHKLIQPLALQSGKSLKLLQQSGIYSGAKAGLSRSLCHCFNLLLRRSLWEKYAGTNCKPDAKVLAEGMVECWKIGIME